MLKLGPNLFVLVLDDEECMKSQRLESSKNLDIEERMGHGDASTR